MPNLKATTLGVWCLLLAAGLAGCDDPTQPDTRRQLGFIVAEQLDDAPHIVVPDTVQAGESFAVSVRTYGHDTCWKKNGTEVGGQGLSAIVTPYDIDREDPSGKTGCRPMVQRFTHETTLTFPTAGTGMVIFQGRNLHTEEFVSLHREVIVR